MKMKSLLSILTALVLCFALSGCATSDLSGLTEGVAAKTSSLRSPSTLVGIAFLASTKDRNRRVENANNLYALAHAVRTFSGSAPLTVQGLEKGLRVFMPDYKSNEDMAVLIGSVAALYGSVSLDTSNNARVYLNALEQVALGLEDAAAPWITKPIQ